MKDMNTKLSNQAAQTETIGNSEGLAPKKASVVATAAQNRLVRVPVIVEMCESFLVINKESELYVTATINLLTKLCRYGA